MKKGIISEEKYMPVNDVPLEEKEVDSIYKDNIRMAPLSYSQQQMWIIDQMQPGNHAYNLPVGFRLKGDLNVEILENSFNEIIRRHETLRTTFCLIDNQPKQIIHSEYSIKLRRINLENQSIDELDKQLHKSVIEEVTQPFDLTSLPLMRVTLLKLSDNENILVLNLHHIISDGYSTGIIFRELSDLYNNYLIGNLLHLQELPIQYSDYVNWQHQKNWNPSYDEQLNFWTNQLDGVLPTLELPFDKKRAAIQSPNGSNKYFFLSQNVVQKIQSMGLKRGCTFFMTVLAAFQVFLSKYSGMDDIIIGTPISNRPRKSDENLIGNFLNIVALRTNLSDNPDFSSLLQRTQKITLDALKNRDLPFENIVEHLKIKRDLSRNPVFQVMLQVLPKYSFRLSNIQISNFNFDLGYSQFDLSLHLYQVEDGYNCRIEYDTDLFESSTIERMVSNFQYYLNDLPEKVDLKISEISILNPIEKNRILKQWNETGVDFPKDTTLIELFENQVKKTPNAIAVKFRNKKLTYFELNKKANQLGNYLKSIGVGPEEIVGICLERSLEMVIGIYGILKAGGAYLPIDPDYPIERIDFIAADSRTDIILSLKKFEEKLIKGRTKLLHLDTDWNIVSNYGIENPVHSTTPDNLAYVIYTSGSTGIPKGVMNEHQGICNRLFWMQENFKLDKDDIVLQKTTFSFDVSVWEFFWPLLFGAQLVIAEPEGHKDPEYLINTIISENITTIHFVPSMLHAFLNSAGVEGCNSLKSVICSGEALSYELQQLSFNKLEAKLYNLYGPTEAAVDVTCWTCTPHYKQNLVPIGKPIANTQIYILDTNLNPVPIGVTGELFIGGIQVARGYLNRNDLTKERFIQDPFSSNKKARLYKTGDLAKYIEDGNIAYIGRTDFQVKVNGFRIELGEIEQALKSFDGIDNVLVTDFSDENCNKRLVAYYTTKNSENLGTDILRDHLKEKLPTYMIPSIFNKMEEFPLTSSGKINRKELPNPNKDRMIPTEIFVAPRNEKEILLTQIWSEVLGVKKIGMNDNFFELGGDSILSIQIVSRANHAHLGLKMNQIFQYQTIAELANVAITLSGKNTQENLISGPVELSAIQKWFFELNNPEPHHWNLTLEIEVNSNIDHQLMKKVISNLLEHHDSLRLRFFQTELGWTQLYSEQVKEIPYSSINFSYLTDFELNEAIKIEVENLHKSLNLENGPLLRFLYVECGRSRKDKLLIVFHHLVIDGVSLRIIFEDLQLAYEHLTKNQEIKLPHKTSSFKEAVNKLIEYSDSLRINDQLNYWSKMINSDISTLPVDFKTHLNTESTVASFVISINVQNTTALIQEVPKAYNTQINDVLITTLAITLSEWIKDSHSIMIDMEGHGREEIYGELDISRTVGWFTTVFPVIIKLNDPKDLGQSLKYVKELLRSIPDKGLGFGVMKYLSTNKEIRNIFSQMPKSEIIFNYLGNYSQLNNDSSAIFNLVPGFFGPLHSPNAERRHLLEVLSFISEGKLQVEWYYSKNRHKVSTIEKLADSFNNSLMLIIEHCKSLKERNFTPSDFTEADLSQDELDNLLNKISLSKGKR